MQFLFLVCISFFLVMYSAEAQDIATVPAIAPVVPPVVNPPVKFDFSARTKWYTHRLFSPERLAYMTLDVTMNNYLLDGGKEWGRNVGNYRNALAIRFEQRLVTNATELFMGQLLDEDTRYRVSSEKKLLRKVQYATFQSFMAYDRDGRTVPAYAHYLAVSAGIAVSNQQHPFPKDGADVTWAIASTLIGSIGDNLRTEFGVDERVKSFGRRMLHKMHKTKSP